MFLEIVWTQVHREPSSAHSPVGSVPGPVSAGTVAAPQMRRLLILVIHVAEMNSGWVSSGIWYTLRKGQFSQKCIAFPPWIWKPRTEGKRKLNGICVCVCVCVYVHVCVCMLTSMHAHACVGGVSPEIDTRQGFGGVQCEWRLGQVIQLSRLSKESLS